MDKLEAGLLAAVGFLVGAVMTRAVRERRAASEQEEAPEDALAEAREAARHAATAAGRARVAAEKTIEHAQENGDFGEDEAPEPAGQSAPEGRAGMDP